MASSTSPRPRSGASRRPSGRQAAVRRRRLRLLAAVSALALLASAGALVGVRSLAGSSRPALNFPTGPAPASVVHAVTSMPVAQQLEAARSTQTVAPSPLHGPALTMDGKPEVLYIGAEFCPFCAAERWALVSALSHFGTWSGLEVSHSSSTDAYPDTPTLSFRSATYTSSYLSFRAVEESGNTACRPGQQGCGANGYQLLQEPTPAQQRLLDATDPQGSIPFIDLGGTAYLVGASYDPSVLAGQTPEEVAKCLSQPNTTDAKQIGAAAAAITQSLCRMTAGVPASTCSQGSV